MSLCPPTQTEELPEVAVESKSGFSIVWLIPLIAIKVGGWLAYKTISEKGPTITITFKSAAGLEAGKTKIKFKDVEVGLVESIVVSDDLSHVTVKANLVTGTVPYLNEDTKFWVERPRIGASEVSGLGTLFSGAYIGIDPGFGATAKDRKFTGLEEPPVLSFDTPGQKFILKAETRGSLSNSSPVYFRDLKVGEVTGYELAEDEQSVTIHLFVHEPHHKLVRENTKFWNASGVDVSAGADGFQVHMASLATLLSGGIGFETRTPEGPTAKDGAIFELHQNYASINQPVYTQKITYVAYFDGSVRGLEAGAPVQFRGINLGEVREVKVEFDPKTNEIRVPVSIDIEPERVPAVGDDDNYTIEDAKQAVEAFGRDRLSGCRAHQSVRCHGKWGRLIRGPLDYLRA